MNFLNWGYLPFLIPVFLVFTFIVIFYEKRFFETIRTYWFYKRSLISRISSFFMILGVGGLLLSLLDARGPEEKVKTPVPKQRTIIMIDTSASMLAEDVKPSRLQKAVLIAKHFARKAVGHQISIVVFSEIQKTIVPFTADLDLIDSRLESIKNLRNQYGSSALTVAVQEAVQYFYDGSGDSRGNLVVFTDGEETSEGVKLKVPDGIHVALVGVGTEQGGRIPLDDSRGLRFGYKNEKGKDVITKLNENFFKTTASDLPSAKYWLTNTYSLPSEEILEFFSSEDQKSQDEQDMVIRPVMMEWIVVPSVLLLIVAWSLKFFRVLVLGLAIVMLPAHANEEKKVELTPEVLTKLEQLQKGKLNSEQKVKLADDLYRQGAKAEALDLYNEGLHSKDVEVPDEAYLNYGTALLDSGKAKEGLSVYDDLNKRLDSSSKSQELRKAIDNNIMTYFRAVEQQKKQQKKNDKKEDQNDKNKKDQNQQQSSGSKSDQQKKEEEGKDQQKKDDSEKDKGDKKEDKEEKDQDGNEKKDQENPSKPLPEKKLAPKLKQLMSDDRQLQMRMIEQGTKDLNKKKNRSSKDW